MHLPSLFLFTVVLIIALNTMSTSGKAVKTIARVAPTATQILGSIKTSGSTRISTSKILKEKKFRKKRYQINYVIWTF